MPTVRTHSPEGWHRQQLRGKVCSFPRSSPSPLELIGKRKSQGEGRRVGWAPDGTGTQRPPSLLKAAGTGAAAGGAATRRGGQRGGGDAQRRGRSRRPEPSGAASGAASGATAARAPREAPRLFYSPSDIMSCPAAIGCRRARARRHVLGAGSAERRGARPGLPARTARTAPPSPPVRPPRPGRPGTGALPRPGPRRSAGAPWPRERLRRALKAGAAPPPVEGLRLAPGDSQRRARPRSNKEVLGEMPPVREKGVKSLFTLPDHDTPNMDC